ncbi:cysteine-rich repeat secretory protein 38-like [Lycium barbarum]|uniref:cysteine-rich repeat secretory protein 38-like n=1 Tax=Lycium barbarum TaxID=112863 RepID=UPI00293EBA80|nr:cysteine-rich repeat secretory protein 38-like [Lycium barbarum]
MASPKFTISCFFFLSSIVILVQTSISVDPLFNFCSKSGNFTAKSYYAKNLKNLLGDLYFKTPLTGFSTSLIGKIPYQTYGLSLCRGDISSKTCKSRIANTSEQLGKYCPYDKEAIIWYDNCLLKYSDKHFLGKIDNTYKYSMPNNLSKMPELFNAKAKVLLGSLVEKTYYGNLYATGEVKIGENKKLYGLVQRTRDVSGGDCKKCLEGIISTECSSCCDGKEGGRVFSGSCNFRYEIYPFISYPRRYKILM